MYFPWATHTKPEHASNTKVGIVNSTGVLFYKCLMTVLWTKMDTGSADWRRQSYGGQLKGVIASNPYQVWTPLPAAPYSCVNITVQAANEQTWFKEQITEQKQPMPFKGSTLSYRSSINRSVDRSCCMYLLASRCLKVRCYMPAWSGTMEQFIKTD